MVGCNHTLPAHLKAPCQLPGRFKIHVMGGSSENSDNDFLHITQGCNMLGALCFSAVLYLRDRDVQQVVVGEAAGMHTERLRN